jgi:hypothetical protein
VQTTLDSMDGRLVLLLGSSASLDKSPKVNWVEKYGGLPPYVREIARSIHEKRGQSLDHAIAIAISRIKLWAAGVGNVKPDTQAKAAKALAQWEALKARAGAARAVKATRTEDGDVYLLFDMRSTVQLAAGAASYSMESVRAAFEAEERRRRDAARQREAQKRMVQGVDGLELLDKLPMTPSSEPDYRYVREVWNTHLIVSAEGRRGDAGLYKIPYEPAGSGADFKFGKEQRVRQEYVAATSPLGDEYDALVLALAGRKPRRVRSVEGQKLFGQPIGSVIRADKLEEAMKLHGAAAVQRATSSEGAAVRPQDLNRPPGSVAQLHSFRTTKTTSGLTTPSGRPSTATTTTPVKSVRAESLAKDKDIPRGERVTQVSRQLREDHPTMSSKQAYTIAASMVGKAEAGQHPSAPGPAPSGLEGDARGQPKELRDARAAVMRGGSVGTGAQTGTRRSTGMKIPVTPELAQARLTKLNKQVTVEENRLGRYEKMIKDYSREPTMAAVVTELRAGVEKSQTKRAELLDQAAQIFEAHPQLKQGPARRLSSVAGAETGPAETQDKAAREAASPFSNPPAGWEVVKGGTFLTPKAFAGPNNDMAIEPLPNDNYAAHYEHTKIGEYPTVKAATDAVEGAFGADNPDIDFKTGSDHGGPDEEGEKPLGEMTDRELGAAAIGPDGKVREDVRAEVARRSSGKQAPANPKHVPGATGTYKNTEGKNIKVTVVGPGDRADATKVKLSPRSEPFDLTTSRLSLDTSSASAAGTSAVSAPGGGEASSRGIAPGQYHVKGSRSVGKAHMIVNADGTGTYVNSRGEKKALSAAQVEKNHKAGMSHKPGDETPSQPSNSPQRTGSITRGSSGGGGARGKELSDDEYGRLSPDSQKEYRDTVSQLVAERAKSSRAANGLKILQLDRKLDALKREANGESEPSAPTRPTPRKVAPGKVGGASSAADIEKMRREANDELREQNGGSVDELVKMRAEYVRRDLAADPTGSVTVKPPSGTEVTIPNALAREILGMPAPSGRAESGQVARLQQKSRTSNDNPAASKGGAGGTGISSGTFSNLAKRASAAGESDAVVVGIQSAVRALISAEHSREKNIADALTYLRNASGHTRNADVEQRIAALTRRLARLQGS